MNTLFLAIFTIGSGLADSQAFIHSSKIWEEGKLVWHQVGFAAGAFALGLVLYWIAIYFANRAGVVSPEVQTIGWFVATIVGVSLVNRSYLAWALSNKILGIAIVLLLAVLAYRTTGTS